MIKSKSNILNIKTKEINEKNLFEKKEKNNDKSLKPKIFVKSQYILKKILLNLDERKKLILLKYNKYYRKIIKINIEDYQKICGIIMIAGINGYGKEYELKDLKLKFEGYYKKGKRNGKGKEYYNDADDNIFEGEYINGIKNGEAIEYNNKGILFVGEYLNGKRWNGIIKEYYDNTNIIKFSGHYCEGKKIGNEYDINGHLIFEGKYFDDKRWNGIIYNSNNNHYLFPIKNGNGKVKEYDIDNKLIFEGEYINGVKKGKEYDKDGTLLFEGEYLNEIRWNGKIKLIHKNKFRRYSNIGSRTNYEEWIEDKNIQKKLKKYENILIYEGEYLNGKRNGKGKEYDKNGKIIFEGEYLNGKRNGKGREYDKNGKVIFEGEFFNGERNGKEKEYNIKNKDDYNNDLKLEFFLVLEGNLKNGLKDGIVKKKEKGK